MADEFGFDADRAKSPPDPGSTAGSTAVKAGAGCIGCMAAPFVLMFVLVCVGVLWNAIVGRPTPPASSYVVDQAQREREHLAAHPKVTYSVTGSARSALPDLHKREQRHGAAHSRPALERLV